MIALRAGDWRAEIRPDIGGAVGRLDHAGRPVLRPAPEGASEVQQTGCFPLVPFANRIADGRFVFRGQEVRLPTPPDFAPHALHGEGWRRAWRVTGGDHSSAELALDGGGDAWPWRWRAAQRFELGDQGLRINLAVTNLADDAMPAGLGLHPYLPKTEHTRLELHAAGVWTTDAREIPDALRPPAAVHDWSDAPRVAEAPFVDHCYTGRSGAIRLIEPDRVTVIQASDNARWTQVYAPPGEAFVCAEPVTHRPDAVHAPAGEGSSLAVLEPGETLSMWVDLALG